MKHTEGDVTISDQILDVGQGQRSGCRPASHQFS
jgi:hypothetical protein